MVFESFNGFQSANAGIHNRPEIAVAGHRGPWRIV